MIRISNTEVVPWWKSNGVLSDPQKPCMPSACVVISVCAVACWRQMARSLRGGRRVVSTAKWMLRNFVEAAIMLTAEVIPRNQWPVAADRIEVLARENKCLGRYRQLISQLRRGVIGERCEERAVQALRKLG